MYRYYLSFTMILFSSLIAAQSVPLPHYVEADPLWVYVPKDEHYVVDTFENAVPGANEYSSLLPSHVVSMDDDLLIWTRSRDAFLDPHGGMLSKVDKDTGEQKWVHYLNKDTGAGDTLESYRNMYINPDGNLELLGKRSKRLSNHLAQIWRYGGAYIDPIRRIFDVSDGNLLETTINTNDTTSNELHSPGLGDYIPMYGRDEYVYTIAGTWPEYKYYLYPISGSDFSYTGEEYTDTIKVDDTLAVLQYDKINYFGHLKNNDFLYFAYYAPYDTSKSPKFIVKVMDYTDISEPKERYSKDLTNYIDFTKEFNLYFAGTLYGKNENLALWKTYGIDDIGYPYTWLLWLDSVGNVVQSIDTLKIGQNTYNFLRLIDIRDEQLLLMANPSTTGRDGFDFISITRNGNVNLLGSLTTDSEVKYTYYTNRPIILDDDKILLISTTNTPYSLYACFRLEDLGIDLSSGVKSPELERDFDIFPNPSNGRIHIDGIDEVSDLTVYIYDMNGKQVLERSIFDKNDFEIDSHLIPGAYTLKVVDKTGNNHYNTKKFIIVD
ncbi:MAG: T9SS type A sorting domain-containing protein [Saprospiraceae bacterium]|nr:T9SS type A sorting domain-containing protein [Saprospiraceae bacterium]MCB9327158.1 T9SS type A sorting domain-containing protein [Lewinellaceae bacterium]